MKKGVVVKKTLSIILGALLALAGVAPAHAYSNSVSWVGNGGYVSNGNLYASTQQCDINSNYLLWVMTANNATAADINFGNGPIPMTQKSKGSFKYVQTFDGTLPAPSSVVATYNGTASNAKLVISHGCNGTVTPPPGDGGDECGTDDGSGGSDDGDDESCCAEDEDGSDDGSHNGDGKDDGDDDESHNCAALTVTKAAVTPTAGYVGGIIRYTITVTNSGSVDLTNVTVSDNNADSGSVVCSPTTPTSLAVGASLSCTAAHTITSADMSAGFVKNIASASSDQKSKDSNEVTVPLTPAPNLAITKSQTNTGPFTAGGVIRYSITAQNTGNVPLTNVRITDANATLGTCSPALPATLAVGASVTCSASHTVTAADMTAGQVVNVARANSDQTSKDSNSVITPLDATPGISITKSLTGDLPAAVGDVITYLLVATNTGTVALNNVVISDNNATIQLCSITPSVTLNPGASLTCAATHTVTQADVDAGQVVNRASVSSTQSSANSNEIIVPINPNPALSVVKSVTGDLPTAAGDIVTFVVEVTNTGNRTLSNVTVSDTNAVLDSCSPGNPADLTPGSKITCTYKHTVTDNDMKACQVVNTATASSGNVSATSNQVLVPIDCTPILAISKELVGKKPNVLGDIVTYRITVTNTGKKQLTGVTVSDANANIESCIPNTPATLEVGETITCTATHIVNEAEVATGYVDNVAKAKSGNVEITSNLIRLPLQQVPALGISKRVTGAAAQKAGDKIQYIIVATNTGDVLLHDVTVSDDNAVITSCDKPNPVPELEIGASVTCQAYHTVTKADVVAGEVINIAIATASENVYATSGAGSGFQAGENGDVKSNQVITKLKATSASGTNTTTKPTKPKTKKLAFTGGEGPIGHDANDLLLTLVLLSMIGLALRRRLVR